MSLIQGSHQCNPHHLQCLCLADPEHISRYSLALAGNALSDLRHLVVYSIVQVAHSVKDLLKIKPVVRILDNRNAKQGTMVQVGRALGTIRALSVGLARTAPPPT